MPAQDYYQTLGVDKSATPDQIKKAYRKLAMKWHPDRNPDDKANAESKFKEIGEAYSVLSDEDKRKKYDQFGHDGPPSGGSTGFTNHGASDQGGQFTFGSAENLFQHFMFNFGDGHGMGHGQPRGQNGHGAQFGMGGVSGMNGMRFKGDTVQCQVGVTLEELYFGRTKTMRITRKRVDAKTGSLRSESKTLRFEIKKGWKSGTTITFEGEGDEAPNMRPGDVQFVITQRKHDQFERDGHDLIKTVRITLKQALMGVCVNVPTLDGRTLKIPVTEKTIYPGFRHKVCGEGMPVKNTEGKGDLVIKFEVQFPDRLSDEQKETISRCL